jgi:delta 1-pyrroline-5-carboxylate dehydrogenase
MALLKNWMQMAGMNVRKAHAKHFHPLPRLASFIGTTNQKNLLSDPTGSRRFLCVEVQSKINCEGIEHDQIYAQLKNELQKGERHWFTSAEEEAIMRSNEAFYKRPIEEDVFHACFRAACPGDLNVHPLSAASIFQILKEKNPAAMRSSTASNFGKVLTALHIERKHTRYGNLYQVVPLTLHTFHRI